MIVRVMVITPTEPKAERRSVIVAGRTVIISGGIGIRIGIASNRRSGRIRRLVLRHVKIDSLWYAIFRGHHMSCLEHSALRELISGRGRRFDHIVLRTEVMKCSVFIAKDFKMERGHPYV